MKVRVHVDIDENVINRIQELTRTPIKEFIETTLNKNYDQVIQLLMSEVYRD